MPEPHLRAADTDREAVAAALGTHMAAGRLTLAEYDERLAHAYAARTYGELAELTADLPAPTPAASRPAEPAAGPAPSPRPVPMGCGSVHGRRTPAPAQPWAWHGQSDDHSWRAWLTTSVTVLAIYLAISIASWDLHYFWPIWVIGPWGAALLASRFTGYGARTRDERPQVGR
jgi:Domain of unknown function (DUF1707)